MNRSVFSHTYTPMNEDERVANLIKKQREKIESIKSDYFYNKELVEKLRTENNTLRKEVDFLRKEKDDLENYHTRTSITVNDEAKRLSTENYYQKQEIERYQIMTNEANKSIDLWKHEVEVLKEQLNNRAYRDDELM